MTIRKIPLLLLRGMTAIILLVPASQDIALAENNPSSRQIDRYRQTLAIDPDNLPLHYYLGVALLLENQNREAVREFRRAYPAFADSIEMNYNLGLAFTRLGDSDSALLYFEQAEALGALDSPELYPLGDAYYNLGLAYLEADALDDAARLFHKVLALDPSRVEIDRLLGDLYARQGETDKAIEALTAYLDRYPADGAAREYIFTLHFNEALKYLEKDEGQARNRFEKALAASPDSPLALYYLGYLDYRQDQPAEAVRRLTQGYDKAPPELQGNIRSILFNCALTLKERNQPQAALEAIETLIPDDGGDPKILFLAGNIALDLKDFIRARNHYERVLAIDPVHRGAILNLVAADAGAVARMVERGRDLFRSGKYSAALHELEGALAINPSDSRGRAYAKEARIEVDRLAAEHFTNAARVLDEGDPQQAIDQVRAGLALTPEAATGLALREKALGILAEDLKQTLAEGQHLLDLGEFRQAEEAFDRALAMNPEHEEARKGKTDVGHRLRKQALAANDRGQRALEEGKLLEARAAFAEALVLQPGLQESEKGLARAEVLAASVVNEELQWGRRAASAGKFGQAREHFTNALRLRDTPEIRLELESIEGELSSRIEALLKAAGDKATREDFKGARRLYNKILTLAPRHGAATAELNRLSGQKATFIRTQITAAAKEMADGNFHEALRRYRRVLDIDPSDGEALAGLNRGKELLGEQLALLIEAGKTALADGRYQEAEATLLKALTLDPYSGEAQAVMTRLNSTLPASGSTSDPQKLYLQGIELYTLGHYQEAVAVWEQVLSLSPDHEKALLNIEKARRKLRQIREYQGG